MNRIKKFFEYCSENKPVAGFLTIFGIGLGLYSIIKEPSFIQDTRVIKGYINPNSCKFKENIKESNYKGKLTIRKNHNPEDIKKYISIYKNFQPLETKNGYKKLNSLFQSLENVSTVNENNIEVSGCLRTNKGIFYITKSTFDRADNPVYLYIIPSSFSLIP
ncbi:MAG: hypothetical protein KAU26_05325 [Methylococcales bacterium]|nr:hypothetical protein [Methylococcales bacterium]